MIEIVFVSFGNIAQHGVATDAASRTLPDSQTQVPTQAMEAQMIEECCEECCE